jgi:hypothetical protein
MNRESAKLEQYANALLTDSKKIAALEQQLEKCKEILRFYGDSENYLEVDYYSNTDMDGGQKARTLLKELEDD